MSQLHLYKARHPDERVRLSEGDGYLFPPEVRREVGRQSLYLLLCVLGFSAVVVGIVLLIPPVLHLAQGLLR